MRVTALKEDDGTKLWHFEPEVGLWNFIPMFEGDGTVMFQTQNGDAYKLRLSDGSLIWESVERDTCGWTDGGCMLGHNGILYVAHAWGGFGWLHPKQKSDLRALRTADGKELWRHHYKTPPNSWPFVAKTRPNTEPEVLFPYAGQACCNPMTALIGFVNALEPKDAPFGGMRLMWMWGMMGLYMGLGQNDWGPWMWKHLQRLYCDFDWPNGFTSFQPETGKVNWEMEYPLYSRPSVRGDSDFLHLRQWYIIEGYLMGQPEAIPNPWTSPIVDAEGTVFTGNQDGKILALEVRDGECVIRDELQTDAAFPHGGPGMAPGMLVFITDEAVFCFREAETPESEEN